MTAPALDRSLISDLVLLAVSLVLLAVVLVLTFADSGRAASASDGRHSIGKLTRRTNIVRRRIKGELIWNALGDGASVFTEDAVYVGADSDATVVLDDGSRIEIDESSLVVIGREASAGAGGQPAVAVNILQGGAVGRAGRRRLAMRAGLSTARLGKGTAARVRLKRDETASVAVRTGEAEVLTGGSSEMLKEGQRRTLDATGRAVGRVEQVRLQLVAPAPGARVFFTRRARRIAFSWQPAGGPEPYTLEVAKDAGFEHLVSRLRSAQPRAVSHLPSSGVYYWRVKRRSMGELHTSEERRLTAIEDVPPVPYRPVAGSDVELSQGRPLAFAWGAVPGVSTYLLEVARGSSFRTPLYALRVFRPSHILRPSETQIHEGPHCFRVRSDAAERGVSPWSEPVCFGVSTRPRLRAPQLYEPSRDEDAAGKRQGSLLWRLLVSSAHAASEPVRPVRLRWEKLTGAAAYVLEIATDRGFEDVVLRQQVTATTFKWQPPQRRVYFWRVRGIDASGREGKVSEPLTVDIDPPGPAPTEPPADTRVRYGSKPPRVRLVWPAQQRYHAYVIELAPDATFSGEVERVNTRQAELLYRPRRLGRFFWRVVGVRTTGGRSLPGPTASFLVEAAPPRPISPASNARLVLSSDSIDVTLAWTRRPVERYAVELASDAAFTQQVAAGSSRGPSASFAIDSPGTLYWRVRAANPTTSWGPTAIFVVEPAPPQLMHPEDGARFELPDGVTLSWQPAPAGDSYLVSLEHDRGATVGSQTIAVAGTQATVETTVSGQYAWSVRTVAGDMRSAPSERRGFTVVPVVRTEGDGPGSRGIVPPPPPPRVGDLHLAPRVGLVYNLGEVLAGRFGAEVGLRAALGGHQVGLALTAAYFTQAGGFSACLERIPVDDCPVERRVKVESRLHGVPIELVAVYVLPTPIVDVTSGAGLSVTPTYTSISVPGQSTVSSRHTAFAGVAVLGVEQRFGAGSVFGELSFAFGTRSRGTVETESGVLSFNLGYRIEVW